MNPSGCVKTAVIGYGYAGEKLHVPLIALAEGLNLVGVCSSDPDKRQQIQQQWACRAYETFEQVLADPSVELVVLATPNLLHASQALAALAAGKHVVTDKPMCVSSQEAVALLDQAQQSRRLLSVFHNRRLDGDYLTLKNLLTAGELGDLRWLEMSWQRYGLPRNWRRQASQAGGRLVDLGSHMLDQVLQLFPAKVVSVYARMHHDLPDLDIESHAMVTLTFADGRTAILDTTSVTPIPKPRIFAIGSKVTFVKYGVDPQESALIAGDIDAAREDPQFFGQLHDGVSSRLVATIPGRWRSYYENIAHVLAQDDPYAQRDRLLVTPQQVARQITLLEAARQSAQSGEVVRLCV